MKYQPPLLAVGLLLAACTGTTSAPSGPPAQVPASPTVAPALTATATAATGLDATDLAPVRQYLDALNRGDVVSALAAFTDDVVWERGGQCPPGACVGKTALQREITRDVMAHHKLTPLSVDTSKGTPEVRLELRNDGTQRGNVERVIQVFAFKLKDAKISAVGVSFDGTDPVTAAFIAAQAGTRR